MMFNDEESLLVGARHGPPLAVGYGEKEGYFGSDAFALAPFTHRIAYLEDGDVAVINGAKVVIFDGAGKKANRPIQTISPAAGMVDKAGHDHFMAKEIHEQPEVVGHTLSRYLDASGPRVSLPEIRARLVQDCAAADAVGLRHRLLRRSGRQILVREARASAGRSRCRLRAALSQPGLSRGRRCAVRLAVGRDCRHAGGAARRQGSGPAHRFRRQCPGKLDRPRIRNRLAHLCRTRDRRRLDQGLHLPALGAGLPRHRRGARPRHHRRGGGEAPLRAASGNAAPHGLGASPGGEDRGARP